jgi:peptidoglycan/LPS O-acetylase OafA/YrhL
MATSQQLLRMALVAFGLVMLLLYPISAVWPSGWAWHDGAPHDSRYFMMIVGIYATLGAFLINAARDPVAHLSVIWFAVWSSLVHAVIMGVQALGEAHHRGHLWGDVPALLLVTVVLAVLLRASGLSSADRAGS